MKYFISLLLLVSFISCNKDEENEYLGQTEDDIIQYIEDNNLDATRTKNGVYYVIDEEGEGSFPFEDAYVTVKYTGYFLDGKEFDASGTNGAMFDLLAVIPGFSEGIVNFNNGSSGTMFIPPSLGYGASGVNGFIPGGAVLIFDVEVVKITNPQTEVDIIDYLETNNLEAERSDTGLYYIIEEPGTGDPITESSIVTVAYTGYFLDGVEFDASSNSGVQFSLQNLISGFKEGLTYFKEGGKGTLLLPPELAYGDEGSATVPRSAVLIFEVDVKSLDN
ncbi:FKBP-type peptidyl-prolyl cis-trans isomerase [Lutibacter agarilyticus]|uniref:Peptidyl-prolyl cis-trans isomerase n=1 Tax=Lutibacter agarilyticus TaxID=1109740 RepID=A0A238WI82_9FLAO|nr:FKBP-type peptidyl-prolyl cis-trans isomerase [Lutibacter agarilyticus]SNR46272.1 FKBP-type peptidyl-prolyl cis-trans isomerase [Lutibacter agarilyticus]